MLNEREEIVALWIILKWFYSQIASIQNHFLIRNSIAVICALYFVLNISFQIALALISLLYSRLKNKAILCFIDIANFEECYQRERAVNQTYLMNCLSEVQKDVWQSSPSIFWFLKAIRVELYNKRIHEKEEMKNTCMVYCRIIVSIFCYVRGEFRVKKFGLKYKNSTSTEKKHSNKCNVLLKKNKHR